MASYTFQHDTPFGPAGYTAHFDPSARVTDLQSSTDGLSEVMLKLSFGEEARTARRYFAALKENVRFQLEVVPFLQEVPMVYRNIRGYFGYVGPQAATGTGGDPPGLRAGFWQLQSRYRPALFEVTERSDAVLQKLVSGQHRWRTQTDADTLAALEPWVLTLFDLVDFGSVAHVWKLLGMLGTATAADRLLSELERKGLHPRGMAILEGLSYCLDAKRDGDRLLELSRRSAYSREFARPYLKLLARLQDPEIVAIARRILYQETEAAPEAMHVFEVAGVSDPVAILEEAFRRAGDAWTVFRYLELFPMLAPADRQISLRRLNEKLGETQFTDTAPVIWQQQLPTAWKALLDDTDRDERLAIVSELLLSREPRLIYNGLLQFNHLIRLHPEDLPDGQVLDRLRDLVAHRYDKVAAQAISVIRKILPAMPDLRRLNATLMPVSKKPGFRVAKLMLLRTLGEDGIIASAQKEYFLEVMNQDLSPDEKLLTRSIIKYLKLQDRTAAD